MRKIIFYYKRGSKDLGITYTTLGLSYEDCLNSFIKNKKIYKDQVTKVEIIDQIDGSIETCSFINFKKDYCIIAENI